MEWINCSDRLPELKDDSVLVYFSKTGSIEAVHIEYYFKDITAGHDTLGRPAHTKRYTWRGVTHWMPLPEAPHPKTVMVELLVEDAEYFLTLTPPSKMLKGRYEVASNNFFDAVLKAMEAIK